MAETTEQKHQTERFRIWVDGVEITQASVHGVDRSRMEDLVHAYEGHDVLVQRQLTITQIETWAPYEPHPVPPPPGSVQRHQEMAT